MRTTVLLTTLLLLVGFSVVRPKPMSAQPPDPQRSKTDNTKKAPQEQHMPYHLFQIDSPIIITDGTSIHFQRDTDIVYANNLIKIQIDTSQQWALQVYGCTGKPLPSGCTVHSIRLGNGPWTVSLYHTDNKTLATTISFPDAIDATYIDIRIPKGDANGSTFVQVTPSNGMNHVYQTFYQLAYAMVNNKKLGCPPAPASTPPPGTGCEMSIVPTN